MRVRLLCINIVCGYCECLMMCTYVCVCVCMYVRMYVCVCACISVRAMRGG